MSTGQIQNGIIWQPGEKARSHYKSIFLTYTSDTTLSKIYDDLLGLWSVWSNLQKGLIGELTERHRVDPAGLQVMVGYGHQFFDDHDNIANWRPNALTNRFRFLGPSTRDDRLILPGGGLKYVPWVKENVSDTPFIIQFTANSPLAVSRAYVETERFISSQEVNRGNGRLFVKYVADGFGREDKRSWITFHDGISNVPKGELRRQVISVKAENAGNQNWSINGSYCVFLKISIDIQSWERIPRSRQELLVGRDKLTGCPIVSVNSNGDPQTDSRCPVEGTSEVVDPGNEDFREPPDAVSDKIKSSHVQRANHHREPFWKVDSRRIYRQGYEYLEMRANRYDVGLNFISFQDDPDRTFFILTQHGWLGGTNFGGESSTNSKAENNLLSVISGGTFFVPPLLSEEPFPGSKFFT